MSSDKASQLPFTAHNLFNSSTDARLTRLSKVLSTSSGVDSTLTLVGYGLALASSQIRSLETLQLKLLTKTNHGSSALLRLMELEGSLKTLASMCSDFRTFTRLWGLLGVYAMAKRNYTAPPQDQVLRIVGYGQTLSLGAYYIYENGYYLAMKGVFRSWTPADIQRWAKTSLRMFLAYVVLEFVRLYRVRTLRGVRKLKAQASGLKDGERKAIREEEAAWSKAALMNGAYAPLAYHWAEGPLLSDGLVGGLMTLVGLIKFRGAWAAAA